MPTLCQISSHLQPSWYNVLIHKVCYLDWVNCVLNINVYNFNKLIVSLSILLFLLQYSVSIKSEEMKSAFSGQLDIGGSLTSGNTDTTRLDVEINIRNLKGRFEDNFRVDDVCLVINY